MRAHPLVVVGAVLLVTVLTVHAAAQTPDPWIGTWKLSAAKSKYSPGPSPKNGRIETTAVKGGIHQINRTDPLTGTSTTSEVTGMFDGKDYPVKGNANADTQAFTKIDDHSYQVVSKKAGKVTLTSRVVISPDGKTRTTTQTGTDAQGRAVNNTIVHEKM
jgi:hypothetical protein